MAEQLPPLLALVAACFSLGAAHYPGRGEALSPRWRPVAKLAGWAMLAGSLVLFARLFGVEVGAAWFLLWLGLATFAATVWLSVKPSQVPWVAGLFALTAVATFLL